MIGKYPISSQPLSSEESGISGVASFTESAGLFVSQGVAGQSLRHKQRGYSKVFGKAKFIENIGTFRTQGFMVIKGTMTVEDVIGQMNARGFVTEGDEEVISLLQLFAEM